VGLLQRTEHHDLEALPEERAPAEDPPTGGPGAQVATDLAIWLALEAALIAVAVAVGMRWAISLVLLPLPFLLWQAVQAHRRRRRAGPRPGLGSAG
jgi:hypothetical protein